MANATQGVAILVFLLAFVLMSYGFFLGGSVVVLLLSLVVLGASLALFLKAKALTAASYK
jgi:hypothetical protein